MPPKKKGKSAEKGEKKDKGKVKGGTPAGEKKIEQPLTELEKEFYLIQIRDLEERLERYQHKCDELEVREKDFSSEFDRLTKDKKEIVSFLKRSLDQRADELADLTDRLIGLQQAKEAEKEACENQLAQLRHEFQESKDQLTSENMILAGKLASVEEFRVQKEELMGRLTEMEEQLEKQGQEHQTTISNLEKKAVVDKDSLELLQENQALKELEERQRQQLGVLEHGQKDLARKSLSNQKVVRILTEKCKEQQYVLQEYMEKEHEYDQLKSDHATLQQEVEVLRTHYASATCCCNKTLWFGCLSNMSCVILQEGPSTMKEADPEIQTHVRRRQMMEKLLSLLDSAALLGVGPALKEFKREAASIHEHRTEPGSDRLSVLLKAPRLLPHYRIGDLGLVPRPEQTLATTLNKVAPLSRSTQLELHKHLGQVNDGSMFSTAVSEKQLEEAREKSRRRLFGSSRIFELEEDKKDRLELCGRSIIELRAAEHYGRGVEAVSKADWERAVHFFTKTINLQPQQTRLYVCRAEAYLQLCDFQSAALNYRKASALEPQSEAFCLRLAFIFYLQCLFDHVRHLDALESFAKATELRPDYRPYHMRSLACLAAIGRHSDCLRLVSKRIETEMDDPELYIECKAAQTLQPALALAPGIPEGWSLLMELEGSAEQAQSLALSRAVAGNLQEALQKINTALENNPEEVQYYLFRGTLYRRLKDFSTAIDDFILALDRSGGEEGRSVQAEAQRQLLLTCNDFAVHCFTRGFYEEAVMLLNKAIGMEKREKGLYINRGDCFFKQRELEFALADYQQAEELDPLDRSIEIRFAVVYSTMGQRDYESGSKYIEALENFSRAIQYNPGVSRYYEYRAKARQKLHEEHGARLDIIMSLLLDPSND
ncbi:UNVERIFIED_CONTAM: hypothetical protein FKN15_007071 [Acipenser sinensis]